MAGRIKRMVMLRWCMGILAVLIGTSAHAEKISEITIEGLRRIDKEGVLGIIGSKVGGELSAEQVSKDIETIWAKNFFRDIQVYQEATPDGVRLVWVIEEKPGIRRIRYEGIDGVSKSDVTDVVDVKVGMMLDRARVTENENKIRDVYLEKGYFLADVDSEIKISEDGFSAEVLFRITENEKVMVRSLDLVGNTAILDSEIKPFLQTKEATYISTLALGGTYREEFFQTDLMRIQALYYDKGFVSVKVDQPIVRLAADRKSIYITIPVSEGLAYSVGDVFFGGIIASGRCQRMSKLPKNSSIVLSRSRVVRSLAAPSSLKISSVLPTPIKTAAMRTPMSYPIREHAKRTAWLISRWSWSPGSWSTLNGSISEGIPGHVIKLSAGNRGSTKATSMLSMVSKRPALVSSSLAILRQSKSPQLREAVTIKFASRLRSKKSPRVLSRLAWASQVSKALSRPHKFHRTTSLVLVEISLCLRSSLSVTLAESSLQSSSMSLIS